MENAPDEVDPLIGMTISGRYQLLARIGAGGMGTVYRARQAGIAEREVAVKLLNPLVQGDEKLARRFENEARIISQLRHPNTLKLIEAGCTSGGRLYIVTELLRGLSLAQILEAGPLDPWMTIHLLRQVCDSLAEAHAMNIVHRDLKPGNLFVETVGDQLLVRVLDFGIAKRILHPGLTEPMQIFGTVGYMAPEQALGEEVDSRSDIYSLGVLAYECLAGRLPFDDPNPVKVIQQHVHQLPPPLLSQPTSASLDPELAEIVHALLAKRAAERPSPIGAVRHLLDVYVEHRRAGGPLLRPPSYLAPVVVLGSADPLDAFAETHVPGTVGGPRGAEVRAPNPWVPPFEDPITTPGAASFGDEVTTQRTIPGAPELEPRSAELRVEPVEATTFLYAESEAPTGDLPEPSQDAGVFEDTINQSGETHVQVARPASRSRSRSGARGRTLWEDALLIAAAAAAAVLLVLLIEVFNSPPRRPAGLERGPDPGEVERPQARPLPSRAGGAPR